MKWFILQLSLVVLLIQSKETDAAHQGGTIHWFIESTNFHIWVRSFDNSNLVSCDRSIVSASTDQSITYAIGDHLNAMTSQIVSAKVHDCVDYRNDGTNFNFKSVVTRFIIPPSGNSNKFFKYLDLSTKLHTDRKYANGIARPVLNYSPMTGFLQVLSVKLNETIEFTFPVYDEQADFVKCRFATANEGQDSFLATSNDGYANSTTMTIDENACSFTFKLPVMKDNSKISETYGVALMMDEYISTDSSEVMSSIPVQFRIIVQNCGNCTPPVATFVSNTCETHDPTNNTVLLTTIPSFVEFSPIGTATDVSGQVVYHSDPSIVNLMDRHFYCYSNKTDDSLTENIQCKMYNKGAATLLTHYYDPYPGSIQMTNMNSVTLYFDGAIIGLPTGGDMTIQRSNDSSVHLTVAFTSCQNIGENRLQCEWTKGSSIFLSNVAYHITFTTPVGYGGNMCRSVAALTQTTWSFTPLLLQGTGQIAEQVQPSSSLNVYTDTNYATKVTVDMDAKLGLLIYAEVDMVVQSTLGDFIPYNCFATDTNDTNNVNPYYLIQNGCDTDDTVRRTEKTTLRMRFFFESFRFITTSTNKIYLHFQVKSCSSSSCTVTCGSGSRKKRSINDPDVTHVGTIEINVNPDSESYIEGGKRRKLITKKMNIASIHHSTHQSSNSPPPALGDSDEKCLPDNFLLMVMVPYTSVWVLGLITYSVYRSFYG